MDTKTQIKMNLFIIQNTLTCTSLIFCKIEKATTTYILFDFMISRFKKYLFIRSFLTNSYFLPTLKLWEYWRTRGFYLIFLFTYFFYFLFHKVMMSERFSPLNNKGGKMCIFEIVYVLYSCSKNVCNFNLTWEKFNQRILFTRFKTSGAHYSDHKFGNPERYQLDRHFFHVVFD